jgi:hypothetical protein
MPAPAGAKAFDKDIAVVAIPFAAPLCSCGYELAFNSDIIIIYGSC